MDNLKKRAKKLRREVLELSLETGESHLGGSYSIIELMVSLYGFNENKGFLKEEDKFILSKGHCCYPMQILLREKGYEIAGVGTLYDRGDGRKKILDETGISTKSLATFESDIDGVRVMEFYPDTQLMITGGN